MPTNLRSRRTVVIVVALALWAIVTPMMWRDLARRSSDQVRGPKWVWKLASANVTGSVAYFLLGRKDE